MITVEDLERVYLMGKVEVHALRGVSLSVKQGEFLGVTGESGSGKSTLLHLVGILDQPTAGRVLIDTTDVYRLSAEEQSRFRLGRIGFVFQGFNLLPRMTALENVKLPMLYNGVHPSMRDRKAMDALEMVGLGDRANHQPQQLSGGAAAESGHSTCPC